MKTEIFNIAQQCANFCKKILRAEINLPEKMQNTIKKIADCETHFYYGYEEALPLATKIAEKVNIREGLDEQFLKLFRIELEKPWEILCEWKKEIPGKWYVDYTYLDEDRQYHSSCYSEKEMAREEFIAKIFHSGTNPVWISSVHKEPTKIMYFYNGSLKTVVEE